jgi:hypothetical protein
LPAYISKKDAANVDEKRQLYKTYNNRLYCYVASEALFLARSDKFCAKSQNVLTPSYKMGEQKVKNEETRENSRELRLENCELNIPKPLFVPLLRCLSLPKPSYYLFQI